MKPKEHESKHKEPESETKKQRNPSPDQPPPDISILTHSLTGKMLITKDRKQQLADDAFKNSRFILLYFGATNCKGWTSILQNFVRIAADKGVILDVLFVSFDDTEEEFWSYFINEHGNWWAVPYRSELSVLLRYEFDVSSIPYVLLMRPNGEIISRRVVQDLQVKEPEEALTTWLPHLRRKSPRALGTAVPATGAPSSSIATPNIGTRGSLITSSQTSIPRQLETADAFAPPTTSLQAHTTDSVEPQTPDSPEQQTVGPQPLPPTIAKIITKGCVKYARKP